MLVKLVILVIVSTVVMGLIMNVTCHLEGKPKNNKFRKWWSRHIVDLDNKYHD